MINMPSELVWFSKNLPIGTQGRQRSSWVVHDTLDALVGRQDFLEKQAAMVGHTMNYPGSLIVALLPPTYYVWPKLPPYVETWLPLPLPSFSLNTLYLLFKRNWLVFYSFLISHNRLFIGTDMPGTIRKKNKKKTLHDIFFSYAKV